MFPFWEIRKRRLQPAFAQQKTATKSTRLHQRELMWHPSIWGQFGSEAQSREHLVAVVVLNDLPDGLQRHGVSVELVGVHVVQRGWLWGVTCGPRWTWVTFLIQRSFLVQTLRWSNSGRWLWSIQLLSLPDADLGLEQQDKRGVKGFI